MFSTYWWLWWYDRLSMEFIQDAIVDDIVNAAWYLDDKYWRVRLTNPI